LFQKHRIDLGDLTRNGEKIIHMVAASSVTVACLSNNKLVRIRRGAGGDEQDVIDLGRRPPEDNIEAIFMDPSAEHLIVSLMNARERQYETVYVQLPNKAKPLVVKKLKGLEITAVAWRPDGKRGAKSTGEILLGTRLGEVFETELEVKAEKYVKQVFALETSRPEPITGLRIDKLKVEGKYFVMVTSQKRALQFIGMSALDAPIFADVMAGPGKRAYELPGEIETSVLAFFAPFPSSPTSYAWLAGCGVSYGELDFRSPGIFRARPTDMAVETVMVGEPQLWPYPKIDGGGRDVPLALAATEFHIVMLYADRYDVMCLINKEIVMSEKFPKATRGMQGLAFDPVMESIYAFAGNSLYQIEAVNEVRDIWKLFLDKKDYGSALQYCQDNPAHMDKIYTAEAEELFERGEFEAAAKLFARTQHSFEEIALRFIAPEKTPALKSFLLSKLQALNNREKTQLTMVCTWLVEIYLNTLNTFKEEGAMEAYKILQDEFRDFLQDGRVQDNLDKLTAYDLIASHGNVEDLTFFARLTDDYEKVISHHIQTGQYKLALEDLAKQPNLDLYYRMMPTLIQHVPTEAVEACMGRPQLVPRLLIPAFIRYEQNSWEKQQGDGVAGNQAIRYLEHCVGEYMKNTDQAIHNYLLSLYAKLPDDTRLLAFFDRFGDDPKYDLKYALRLCTQENKKRACVMIYSTMGLFEEAVDLALSVDLELAMTNADRAVDDPELRKKLWLAIAHHVVKSEQDISKAMKVLSRNELLKIEDILPFFPDFARIDHFQDAICSSLEEYNRAIKDLKEDMDHATNSSRNIRQDMDDLKQKVSVVNGDEMCQLSSLPLLSAPFYKFPCGHGFLEAILLTHVRPKLRPAERRQLEKAESQLKAGALGQIKSELMATIDELIASDCPFCGEQIIASIDEPFINPDDENVYRETWALKAV
jgi:hypothetical protein